MGGTKKALSIAALLSLGLLINITPLIGADRSVQFSGYVPARSGPLGFGPLKAYAESFGPNAGIQVTATNHGDAKALISFQAFDGHFRPTKAIQLPGATTLGPGEKRRFLAVVPVMQDVKKRYRICATMATEATKQTRMCGKYIAQRR